MLTGPSEDAVRAALRRMDELAGLRWLRQQIVASIAPALVLPWVLDIDTTIKPLYGHQQGAQLGYNPHKPGRPSHVYHSYFVATLRISLGVEVRPGKEHGAAYGLDGLWQTLETLPRSQWPTLARGDCAYGNEKLLVQFEGQSLPYLFKLRRTPTVKQLVRRALEEHKEWQEAGDGWQVMETSLQLGNWSRARRVILVRESPAVAPVGEQARRRRDPLDLPRRDGQAWPQTNAPWSGKIAVLVSSLDRQAYLATAIARLYRERADAENSFDELKNQWGWNGYSSHQLSACRLMANLIALFYNWWNLYVRFYDATHHREAIASRPALMQGVARQVQSAGQRKVKVSLVHEKSDCIIRAVTLISNQLQQFMRITERWTIAQRWAALLTQLLRRWLGGKWLPGVPNHAALLFSG